MDHTLFNSRLRKGLCTECGTPDKVHYSSRCIDCHKLFQNQSLNWQKEEIETQKTIALQKERREERFNKVASIFITQGQSSVPHQTNSQKETDYNVVFITFLLTAFAVVGFLRLSGAFDDNFESENEIRLNIYSECKNMNGINCEKLLSQ